MHRVGYTVLTAGLVTLTVLFAVRGCGERPPSLPSVDPDEAAGASCEQSVAGARELTKAGALERARVLYLWVIEHCAESALMPEAFIEAGSLFGHLMQRPAEARQAYEIFLQRFPTHPSAASATYHLAKLEIDAGNYPAAVARLTTLAQRYPNNAHAESARFLSAKAAELLAADRQARRTFLGQLAALIPNNILSLLALLAAIGPSVIQTVRQAKSDTARKRWRWALPGIIIGLTLVNYVMNNVDSARKSNQVIEKLEKLDRLLNAGAHSPGAR